MLLLTDEVVGMVYLFHPLFKLLCKILIKPAIGGII